MIGRAISHYRVLSTLGSGGMGVVYLAEDERLGRQVALKFLPADAVTSRQALDRFRIEARAASSLSHPGICAIYDIGEDDGSPYIVMEALKGESLRDRINRGQIKIGELLDIGIQLADALDAAHAQGIIHRDVKPSNIFVGEKNRVKILDFGLAKLAQVSKPISSDGMTRGLDASTHRDLTMPGSALGTVSYMSPEQARGEEVDTRTDLFSLGVVLYEMATGIQAFGGSTHAVVFDAILNRTPQRIAHLNPLVPPKLEELIATALEKERDLRYQHSSDIEAELKRIRRDLESGSLSAAASSSRTEVITPTERAAIASRASISAAQTPAPAVAPRSSSWRYAVSAAAVIVAAAISVYLWSNRSSVSVTPPAPSTPAVQPTIVDRAPAPVAPGPAPTPSQATPAAVPAPASAQTTAPAKPQDVPGRAARGTQQTPPSKPNVVDARPPTPQPVPPPRPVSPPTSTATAAPTSNAALPPPPANDPPAATNTAPSNSTPVQPPPPNPASASVPAPAPAEQPATQPPPRATTAPSAPPALPPTSPVESDEALIRGVIRTYERAIETKSVDLFRSVWPSLSAAEEARLRGSFNQIDSQQVDITVESLRIEGRTATARLSRRDTVMSGGRRQTNNSQQTLRFEKTPAGWVITAIGR